MDTCRTCLSAEPLLAMSPLFGGSPYLAMLVAVAPVRIAEGDGLPSSVCSRCASQMRKAFEFRALCEASDAELRSRLPTAETPKPEPEVPGRPTCDVCGKSFAKRHTLARHAATHLESPNRKLCALCGKSFLRADDLRRHARIHTGERPHACALCPKRFNQSSGLKEHLKSHSTERYVCAVCGKRLASRNGLYVHAKAHRGQKDKECRTCGKRFITNYELASHTRRRHPEGRRVGREDESGAEISSQSDFWTDVGIKLASEKCATNFLGPTFPCTTAKRGTGMKNQDDVFYGDNG